MNSNIARPFWANSTPSTPVVTVPSDYSPVLNISDAPQIHLRPETEPKLGGATETIPDLDESLFESLPEFSQCLSDTYSSEVLQLLNSFAEEEEESNSPFSIFEESFSKKSRSVECDTPSDTSTGVSNGEKEMSRGPNVQLSSTNSNDSNTSLAAETRRESNGSYRSLGFLLNGQVGSVQSMTRQSRPPDLTARLADIIRSKTSKPTSGSYYVNGCLPSAEKSIRKIVLCCGLRKFNGCENGSLQLGSKDDHPKFTLNKAVSFRNASNPDPIIKSRLMELAEAVAVGDDDRASFFRSLLQSDVSAVGSVMQRVGLYFMEGLKARGMGMNAQEYIKPMPINQKIISALEEMSSKIPMLSYCMDVTNDAIMEAVGDAQVVHIIDLTMWSGQWGPLLRSLSGRPGGPPVVRITAVQAPPGTPWGAGPCMSAQPLRKEVMCVAAEAGIKCEYNVVVARLENVQAKDLKLCGGDALVVAGSMRLQQLPDGMVVRSNPRDTFLKKVHSWHPRVFVICGLNINQNSPFFLSRCKEALEFYSALFESFEATAGQSQSRLVFEQMIWSREIMHMIGSEGIERVQREERIEQWQARMKACGFQPFCFNPLTAAAVNSKAQNLHHNFNVEHFEQGLLLCWKEKPVMAAHAWMCQ